MFLESQLAFKSQAAYPLSIFAIEGLLWRVT